MHITRLDIEHFGPYLNRSVSGFSPGLTVLYGPNETGKSALRAFIRIVFFGYPRKNDGEYHFYTYAQSRDTASGSVSIAMGNGLAYTVHRRSGPRGGVVTISGDAVGGNELLDEVIGHVGADFYQDIFSVSLSELQYIETFGAPHIRDRIYSTGLASPKISLRAVMQRLEEETRALRSPRKGRLRETESELAEVLSDLDRERAAAARYSAILEERAASESRVAGLQQKIADLRAKVDHQRRLAAHIPQIERLRQLERDLDTLAGAPLLDEEVVRQFEALNQSAAKLRDHVAAGELRQKRRADMVASTPLHDGFARRAADIQRLIGEVEHYRRAVDEFSTLEVRRRDEQARLERELLELGPGWTEQKVRTHLVDADFKWQVEAVAQALHDARNNLTAARTEVRLRLSEEMAVQESLREVTSRATMPGAPPMPEDSAAATAAQSLPAEAFEARIQAARRLRSALLSSETLRNEEMEIETRVASASSQFKPGALSWVINGLIWVGGFLGIMGLAAAAFGLSGGRSTATLLGVGVTLAGIALAGAGVFGSRKLSQAAKPGVAQTFTQDDLKRLADLEVQIKALGNEVASLLGEAGLQGKPRDASAVEAHLAEMEKELDRKRNSQTSAVQIRDVAARAQSASANARQAEARLQQAEAAFEAAEMAWKGVLTGAGLSPDLTPAQALAFVGGLQSLRAQIASANSLKERVETTKQAILDIETRLASVVQDTGMAGFATMQASSALRELAQRYSESADAHARIQQIREEMADWERERKEIEDQLGAADAGCRRILSEAGAENEAAFEDMRRRSARRAETERQLAELRQAISQTAGAEAVGELGRSTVAEVQASVYALESQLRVLEEESRQAHTEMGRLNEQMRAIEESNQVNELHMRANMLQERYEEDARKWATLVIARDILERTREQFQRERQPSLIQTAGRYFKAMTLGRYSRIEAILGEDRSSEFQVIEGESRAKDLTDLSRGTAEQLYLSMRFALIEEYAKNAEPLPVIMDDVLVNFDPERARAACAAIATLSQKFQVIFLTCHPHIVEWFRELARKDLAQKELTQSYPLPPGEGQDEGIKNGPSRPVNIIDLAAANAAR